MIQNILIRIPISNQHTAWILLVVATMFWGTNTVFSRLAVGEISPMLLVSFRWFGTMLLLSVVAHRDLVRQWPVLRNHLGLLSFLGIVGFAVFTMLYYVAAYTTTAVNIGIMQGSIPVFVLIGAYLVYQTQIGLFQVIGVVLTLSGVVFVISGGQLDTLLKLQFKFGDLLMVGACLSYAAYTIGLRRCPKINILAQCVVMAAAALAMSLPFAVAEWMLGWGQWPSTTGWVITLLVTLFPSLAQVCFFQGVVMIGPGRAGVFINLVPVFAAIFAVTYLGELFKFFHALALSLVLGGIWLSEKSETSKTQPESIS